MINIIGYSYYIQKLPFVSFFQIFNIFYFSLKLILSFKKFKYQKSMFKFVNRTAIILSTIILNN